jgi:glutamate formiminotransferase
MRQRLLVRIPGNMKNHLQLTNYQMFETHFQNETRRGASQLQSQIVGLVKNYDFQKLIKLFLNTEIKQKQL